jgi:hypothetical protein
MALLKPVYETTVVEVVADCNEAASLEMSIRRLDTVLDLDFPFPAPITIVDNGTSDVTWAIAERLDVARPDIISRGYNRLVRLVLGARLGDANSGLMAIRAEVAQDLVQRAGLRVHEVAIERTEDPESFSVARRFVGATW